MDAAADKIDYYITLGKRVYVHCVHGKSRSPAIIIYYLMKYKNFTYDQAFEKILSIRPIISMNNNFVRELINI
jgi:protein-tyrosine phosphatase